MHILVMLQWVVLVLVLALDLNFSVAVTGSMASGGLKVIMLFHLWMFLFPAFLSLLFFRIEKKGPKNKGSIGFSLIAVLFSIAHISLHLVNDLIPLMKAVEVIAWSAYNCMCFVSLYEILVALSSTFLGRPAEIKESGPPNEKIQTQGLK